MFRKQAESVEEPHQLTFMQRAVEKATEARIDKEAKEDADTRGHDTAVQDRHETVTKVSAAADIEFYNKVGGALCRERLRKKLKKFGK